jgi:hypothetical protein
MLRISWSHRLEYFQHMTFLMEVAVNNLLVVKCRQKTLNERQIGNDAAVSVDVTDCPKQETNSFDPVYQV